MENDIIDLTDWDDIDMRIRRVADYIECEVDEESQTEHSQYLLDMAALTEWLNSEIS